MRRRALLAASGASGGGAPEFPLYLYFDYCDSYWGMTSCVREADEIGARYYEYLYDILLSDKNNELKKLELNSLGIEIYIDDKRVVEMSTNIMSSPPTIYFTTDNYGSWHNDGSITMDY